MTSLTPTHVGILRDIKANKISLDEMSDWMRERLVELVFHSPQLIDVDGPAVFLTDAGKLKLSEHKSP